MSTYNVRCVSGRSKQFRKNFSDNNNGTIIDNQTGLLWQKCSLGQSNPDCSNEPTADNWENALTLCNNLDLAGLTWRLPTINEWKSILDTEKPEEPTIDQSYFPGSTAQVYSSSTTQASADNTASCVNLMFGNVCRFPKGNDIRIHCVSDP